MARPRGRPKRRNGEAAWPAEAEKRTTPMDEVKYLVVSKQEAELIMDSFKVSNPLTRNIALKAAGLVLEFAAEDGVKEAERLTLIRPLDNVRLEA